MTTFAESAPLTARPLVILLLVNVLVVGTASCVCGVVRLARRCAHNRRLRGGRLHDLLEPGGPPIEQIAAELRTLLWRHDVLVRATAASGSGGLVRATEVAVTRSAVQAARAVGVAHPQQPMYGGLETGQLRPLLLALADAGLVLPARVALLEPDRRP